MDIWFWVFVSNFALNLLLMLSMIFFERRKLSSTISWLTIITFLPLFGFLLYMLFGSGLSIRVRRMISKHKVYEVEYDKRLQDSLKTKQDDPILQENSGIIKSAYYYGSVLCPNNDVKIYLWGVDKLKALLEDLNNAKETINIEYYIFADDKTGKLVMDTLIRKAKEGVKVRLLYDSVGCLGAPRRFFRKLKKAGGEVGEFFPPFAHIRMINFKMNYRNHRKIVVIDGKIAYTGGINLRNDHMGLRKKLSPWRDTHIRVEGSGVYPLQRIFLNDWRYVKKEKCPISSYMKEGLFKEPEGVVGNNYIQVATSGPDYPVQGIKELYIKLITNAKKSVLIQSPYFIPDDSFMSALRIALASGVKVKILFPSKPDHRTVFWVSQSYLKEVVGFGAEVYFYDGFLHSKMLIIDDDKVCIGTVNIDNRSFGLNFEDTVLIYSKQTAQKTVEIFENDITHSSQKDFAYFRRKPWYSKFAQAIFRLFSQIL